MYFNGIDKTLEIWIDGDPEGSANPGVLYDMGFTAHIFDTWPEVKGNMIDIPGMSGSLDLSEALGGVTYSNRRLKLQLHTIPERASAQEDIDAFMLKYSGQRVWLRVKDLVEHEWLYSYIGRISPIDDDMGRRLRTVTFDVNADPFRYKTDTAYAMWAQEIDRVRYLFPTEDLVEGSVPSQNSTDGITTIWYPSQAGLYNIYEMSVERGANYFAAPIQWGNRVRIDITDLAGNAYDLSGFIAKEDKIRIKVTFLFKSISVIAGGVIGQQSYGQLLGSSAVLTVSKLPIYTFENAGLPVQIHYTTIADTNATLLYINGELIPLQYTGWGSEETDPGLVLKHGTNKIGVIINDEVDEELSVGQKTFVQWREAFL